MIQPLQPHPSTDAPAKSKIVDRTSYVSGFQSGSDMRIDRHEAKYVVPSHLMPEIRAQIAPYVNRDKNGVGEFPKYIVRTIQLDSRDLTLHYQKEVEALNRFKLRIRTYGTECKAPVFIEIKRKLGGMINKSRTVIPMEHYHPEIITHPGHHIPFRNAKEHMNYLDFLRLVQEIGARPVTVIQYERESYMGKLEDYARVTFDTNVCYQMISDYRFDNLNPRRWRRIDTQTGLCSDYAGFILELKSKRDVPHWLMDVIRKFDLVRCGFCKYSAALRLESLSSGFQYSDTGENCTPDSRW
ncbi:MAG: polyphosphate polymerase domain-containing protein [Verrucomicrobiota bacterium]